MSPASDDAAGALVLRSWVLQVLSSRGGRSLPPLGRVAELAPSSWTLFLATECCALPLAAAVRANDIALPAAADAVLRRAELVEMQRVVAARAQLAALDTLANESGLEPIVLKGGAAVAESVGIDLGDLDLFLSDDDAQRFASVVDRRGYQPEGPDSSKHLARRLVANLLPLEIHTQLEDFDIGVDHSVAELLARTIPLGEFRRLRRLAPEDHIWHVLLHSVVTHPHRRGHVRDLVVIAAARRRCSPDALRRLQRWIDAHAFARMLDRTVGLAAAIEDGTFCDDPFRQVAAAKYVVASGGYERVGRVLPIAIQSVFHLLERGPDTMQLMRLVFRGLAPTPEWAAWYLGRIWRISPSLATALGVPVRAAYRAVGVLVGVGVSLRVRLTTRPALRHAARD